MMIRPSFRDFLEHLTDEQKEQIINDSIRVQNMVFENSKGQFEEADSNSFSDDWFEDDELNHKIDNMLMNGDLGEGVTE